MMNLKRVEKEVYEVYVSLELDNLSQIAECVRVEIKQAIHGCTSVVDHPWANDGNLRLIVNSTESQSLLLRSVFSA